MQDRQNIDTSKRINLQLFFSFQVKFNVSKSQSYYQKMIVSLDEYKTGRKVIHFG